MGRVIKFKDQRDSSGKDSNQEKIADKAIRRAQKASKFTGQNTLTKKGA